MTLQQVVLTRGYGNSRRAAALLTFTISISTLMKSLDIVAVLVFSIYTLLPLYFSGILSFDPTITSRGIVLLCKGTAW